MEPLCTQVNEITTAESFDELEEKIHYYLEHPDIRKEIAQNGYDIVKSQHTYPIRLEQMFSLAYHQ